jgi:hypothetical protein
LKWAMSSSNWPRSCSMGKSCPFLSTFPGHILFYFLLIASVYDFFPTVLLSKLKLLYFVYDRSLPSVLLTNSS